MDFSLPDDSQETITVLTGDRPIGSYGNQHFSASGDLAIDKQRLDFGTIK